MILIFNDAFISNVILIFNDAFISNVILIFNDAFISHVISVYNDAHSEERVYSANEQWASELQLPVIFESKCLFKKRGTVNLIFIVSYIGLLQWMVCLCIYWLGRIFISTRLTPYRRGLRTSTVQSWIKMEFLVFTDITSCTRRIYDLCVHWTLVHFSYIGFKMC